MKDPNYNVSITVDATVQQAFTSINKVIQWWTENLEGSSEKLNDVFTVRFGDVHVSTQKVVEFVPGEKVVWLVTGSKLNFVANKQEWNGTKISFELSARGNNTLITFTHIGLTPAMECFNDCSPVWGQYIQQSLLNLINTGKGQPAIKEAEAAN